jgi:hypothetical protein
MQLRAQSHTALHAASAEAVRPVAWTSDGPYTNDATAVAASPNFARDQTVFLGVVYNTNVGQPTGNTTLAILRSVDGGVSWTTAWSHQTPANGNEMQGSVLQIAVSPAFATDGTVYALWTADSGGVLRSTDGGHSFQATGNWNAIPARSDTADTLALSPQYGSDKTVAVTLNNGNVTTGYLSVDGGADWHAVNVQSGSGL